MISFTSLAISVFVLFATACCAHDARHEALDHQLQQIQMLKPYVFGNSLGREMGSRLWEKQDSYALLSQRAFKSPKSTGTPKGIESGFRTGMDVGDVDGDPVSQLQQFQEMAPIEDSVRPSFQRLKPLRHDLVLHQHYPRDALIMTGYTGATPVLTHAQQQYWDNAALGRVHGDMQGAQGTAAGSLNSAHAQCQEMLAIEDAQEKKDAKTLADLTSKLAKSKKGKAATALKAQIQLLRDRKTHKIYQYNRIQDLQAETQADFNAMQAFTQQATGAQNGEFYSGGRAKTSFQKEADTAYIGFMKFAHVFAEIISYLAMLIPGEGEILGIGLRLAEISVDAAKTARVVAQVAKVSKNIHKADKGINDIKDLQNMLGVKPGQSPIYGANGKVMQQWQNWMLHQLYGSLQKYLVQNSKKINPAVSIAALLDTLQYPPHKAVAPKKASGSSTSGTTSKGNNLLDRPVAWAHHW